MNPRSTIVAPVPDDDDRFFWDGIADGVLLLSRCARCHVIHHPPTPMCGDCHSLDHETVRSAGTGTVYSWIRAGHPTDDTVDPRIAAVIELAEGVRFVANLVDTTIDEVTVDMPVELTIREIDGVLLPQFMPAA